MLIYKEYHWYHCKILTIKTSMCVIVMSYIQTICYILLLSSQNCIAALLGKLFVSGLAELTVLRPSSCWN